MENRKLYDFSTPSLDQARVYRYGDRVLELRSQDLCPDCSTPTVWMDDDADGNPIIGQLYHDRSCIQVRTGQGEVAPTLAEQRQALAPAPIRIKRYVREHPNSTVEEIAKGAEVAQRTVRKVLGLNR